MKRLYKIIFFFALFLIVGVAIGYFAGHSEGFNEEHSILVKQSGQIYPIRLNDPDYKLINPLLTYSTPPATQDAKLENLRNKISDLISNDKKQGEAASISFYMEDLNRGKWIGVGSDDTYPPASTYKLVVMISYFAAEASTPGLFDDRLVYTKDLDDMTKDSGFDFLQVGQSYTIGDLINKMIIDSDNASELLLESRLDQGSINSFLNIFGIAGKKPDGYFVISPKQFSLLFRTLYNSTSLSIDSSEEALDILSRTTFNDGLMAGVPSKTTVAHKFGYLSLPPDTVYLHDCGIVYYPDNPYFICVMTKGNNQDKLKSVIKNISSLVYQNINK